MDKICVFMSTYNGEKYIREQIDTIFRQNGVYVSLCIRDDGSDDNTVKIIKEYISSGYDIDLEVGKNVGFKESFALLCQKKMNADYYAFADQDDIWDENKFIRAIGYMKTINKPVLYGGNLSIVNEKLEEQGLLYYSHDRYCYEKRLIENCAPLGHNMYGCTLVWNLPLQEKLTEYFPTYFISHDVYLCMLASVLGTIIVDEKPMIKHRLHLSNTSGVETRFLHRIVKGYKNYFGRGHRELDTIAREIILNYETSLQENQVTDLLYKVANYNKGLINKMRLINCPEMKMFKTYNRLWKTILILFGKL